MFKKWLIRLADKWRMDEWEDTMPEPTQSWAGRKKRGMTISSGNKTPSKSNQRVSHNYDDDGVITFKVYGANGGKIIEASRYDDKSDNERIKLYIIEENADFTESLSRIVTMEYLR
jgi:hypothetical protein